jgi:hypothetical protein
MSEASTPELGGDRRTAAGTTAPPSQTSRRAFLVVALTAAAIVLWGFWRTYLEPLLGGGVDRIWLIHLHAAVFFGWLLILTLQASLVARGRVAWHRRVGRAGAAYGTLVFCIGVAVSVGAPAAHVVAGQQPIDRASIVVIYNLTDIVIFGGFFAAAMLFRRHTDRHPRLIVSATVALAGAAVGRVLPGGTLQYFLVWLLPLFAVMGIDLWTRRRLHIVSLLSLGVFTLEFFKVPIFAESTLWTGLGRTLLKPFV